MTSETTTIQVRRPTLDRLNAVKIPGLTYDDVINFALNHLTPNEVQKLYEDWQKAALAKLLKDPRVRPTKRSR